MVPMCHLSGASKPVVSSCGMGQERETGNTELLVPFWGKVCVCEYTAVLHPVHRAVLGNWGSAVGVEREGRVWLEPWL